MTGAVSRGSASLALVRTVPLCPDPTVLLSLAAEEMGPEGTLLLESADSASGRAGRSLVVARSALRLVCRGRTVTVRALNPNGQVLIPWLAEELRGKGHVTFPNAPVSSGTGREAAHTFQVDFPSFEGGDEDARLLWPGPADVLRVLASGLERNDTHPDAAPHLAGIFTYDFIDSFETLPAPRSDAMGWPDYEFWLADRLAWIDHDRRDATVVTHVFGPGSTPSAGGEGIAAMTPLLGLVERATREPAVDAAETAETAVGPAQAEGSGVDLTDDEYAEQVERCKEHIAAGDVFQIVPSRTFSRRCGDPMAAYRRLRGLNPSPYMFYVNATRGVLFGASPETAVKVDGSPRRVHVKPIAGTRPRGLKRDGSVDEDLDGRLEAELRLDQKEVAEHMMLVDLARNDVARVSEPGTRRVDRLLEVERYSHVMHLVSHVSGILKEGLDPLHAYVATMNMGTLVGAPKVKAAELLRRFEATRRGPYGGAVGYVTSDGRMDTAIVIRAAAVQDGTAYVRAGAGVVHDSNPRAEAEETRRKAGAVLDAIAGRQG